MDAAPRRWVLKPLSPVLQPSDLRTISTGPDSSLDHLGSSEVAPSHHGPSSPEVLFQARHITVYQDAGNTSHERPPSPPSSPGSPGSSSSGSQCGFYSFVEDPTSPEAELNEAWMASPQRHAQLATLKMEKGFKLQAYASDRKPRSLFSESNGDSRYRVDLYAGVKALQEEEEKHLRDEIIRNQAPKRSLRLFEGSGVTSRTQQLGPADPSTIDRESISFTAARQQFLKFEQDRKTPLLSPVSFCTTYASPLPRPKENQENPVRTEEPRRQQSNVVDVPDSGLKGLSLEVGGVTAKYETPIEREIRVSQEREENLRRSRGLKISAEEIVEIKTKRLQSPLTPTKAFPGLHQGVQVMWGHDKPEPNEQERPDPDPGDPGDPGGPGGPGGPERKVGPDAEDKGGGGGAQSGDATDSSSPCCPHRHPGDTEFSIRSRISEARSAPEVQDSRGFHPDSGSSRGSSPTVEVMDAPSWREHLQLNGLQSRNAGGPNPIEREIEEVLKREEELQELRDISPLQVFSPPPPVNPRTTDGRLQPTGPVPLGAAHRPTKRMSSISLFTAQPWTSPSSLLTPTGTGGVRAAPPQVGGLTDTLLQDFEERRAQQKLEETSYAGILRLDHINHEVVESTRVTLHKSQRALLWEAGVFANQADQ